MAKRERVWECSADLCNEFVIPDRQSYEDWQEVRVRQLESRDKAVVLALCPAHALRGDRE